MSIITYFGAAPESTSVLRKSLFRRLADRVIAAQEARSDVELKRHSHLLPREFDQAARKIGERSEDSLPFTR